MCAPTDSTFERMLSFANPLSPTTELTVLLKGCSLLQTPSPPS